MILNDIRIQALTPAQIAGEYATFADLPAVRAGQVGNWYFESPYSYRVLADVVTDPTKERIPTSSDPRTPGPGRMRVMESLPR